MAEKKMDVITSEAPNIFQVSFNQTREFCCCTTDVGFFIFQLTPFRLVKRVKMSTLGVYLNYNTNHVVCIRDKSSDVVMYDLKKNEIVGEVAKFETCPSVRITESFICVLFPSQCHFINKSDLQKYWSVDCNDLGCIASSEKNDVVAISGQNSVNMCFVREKMNIHIEKPHESEIFVCALNPEGTLLATASCKGTVIRIFDTKTGKLHKEVRRGRKNATMYSISFIKEKVCCYSSSGKVHVWDLESNKNRTSKLSMLSSLVSYVGSEWSMLQAIVDDGEGKCCFTCKNVIHVMTINGWLKRIEILDNGKIEQKEMSLIDAITGKANSYYVSEGIRELYSPGYVFLRVKDKKLIVRDNLLNIELAKMLKTNQLQIGEEILIGNETIRNELERLQLKRDEFLKVTTD